MVSPEFYGWKPNSTWGTNPVFMQEGGSYYFYNNDHLGTPQKMTDSNGNVVWSATYTAFGEAEVDAASTVTNNLRNAGQYHDEETGLHQNWNRYYDPKTGRYISKDPIGFRGGDVNIFRYVKNNPIIYTDPTGLADPVTVALTAWAIFYFLHAGDAISEPNGNVWDGFTKQDEKCSLGPIFGPLGDACFPERCVKHDGCYTDSECNASSWISNLLGGTKSCNQCNSDF